MPPVFYALLSGSRKSWMAGTPPAMTVFFGGGVWHYFYGSIANCPIRSGITLRDLSYSPCPVMTALPCHNPLNVSCPPLWRASTTFQIQHPTSIRPKKRPPKGPFDPSLRNTQPVAPDALISAILVSDRCSTSRNTSSVCSPSKGERFTSAGLSDSLIGLPTDRYLPRVG